MLDSKLIDALESFKYNYTMEELITFINGIPEIKDFYKERANKFLRYLNEHNELIKKFIDDININAELYDKECERNIINDILQNRLHLFYMMYCIDNRQDLVETNDDIYRTLAIDFFLDDESKIKLIDYIIHFCIISNNNESIIDNILPTELKDLTKQEQDVYKLFFENPSKKVKIVADEFSVSSTRINNIIKKICQKLNLKEENKEALEDHINIQKNKMCKICM